MKKIRSLFVTGLLVLVPLLASIHLLLWFVRQVDHSVRDLIPNPLLIIDFQGLGVVVALVLVMLMGFITQVYAGSWLLSSADKFIRKTPLMGGIYSGIKKFLEMVVNPTHDKFGGVVLVPFPQPGIHSIGFITGTPNLKLTKNSMGSEKSVSVFVPCTPNPTSGFYIIVKQSEIIPIDMTVQEAFRTVISMGMVNE